jgi:pyruvate dehydrogenase E2 component (dihydrolipoamide acetyltransferase)
MIKEITIPEISENVTSGSVVEVLVEPGQMVAVDDPVIEFETEKAVVEIPSPFAGKITEVLVKAGDELNVGDAVAKLETDAEEQPEKETPQEQPQQEETEKAEELAAESEPSRSEETREARKSEADTAKESKQDTREQDDKTPEQYGAEESGRERSHTEEKKKTPPPVPASPSVRRLARELGVDIHEVTTAGPDQRISADDVKTYVKQHQNDRKQGGEAALAAPSGNGSAMPDFSRWGEVEEQELSAVRRLTAESVSFSHQTVVPVTQFEEADITAVEAFIGRHSDKVADQGGKLTLTAVLMKICALALLRFPHFNASIDLADNRLILKKYVHIGMAVDTQRGLLVPVVRDVDRKSILELAVEIVDLAQRTRNKKIKPDEMEGGTFTISNQGGIGGKGFTPVVLWPQTAILGVSRTVTKPRYINGEFQPRAMLPIALTYDHRIVDGADAARFAGWLRECLEHPLTLHLD